jgi:hypothetical protein
MHVKSLVKPSYLAFSNDQHANETDGMPTEPHREDSETTHLSPAAARPPINRGMI